MKLISSLVVHETMATRPCLLGLDMAALQHWVLVLRLKDHQPADVLGLGLNESVEHMPGVCSSKKKYSGLGP